MDASLIDTDFDSLFKSIKRNDTIITINNVEYIYKTDCLSKNQEKDKKLTLIIG
ncbi:UNVERIFIED_CONTAM: hypothetical protein O8I53_07895 [Campylobacter lari]